MTVKNKENITFQCLNDGSVLEGRRDGLYCNRCLAFYPKEKGIYKFLSTKNKFYEGAYKNVTKFLPKSEHIWHIWPLWIINSGWLWEIRSAIDKGSVVLELGCASGVKYLGTRYEMIGCDLSLQSLDALDFYSHRLQADVCKGVPLLKDSVDAVVSSYFWEHIPPDEKPTILQECYRLLKPGGKIIFLHDVETKNPLIALFKRKNIKKYLKEFIDGDGHFGYEPFSKNLNTFESNGFVIVKSRCLEKFILQSPSTYQKLSTFDGYLANLFLKISFVQNPPYFYLYSLFMRIADSFLCLILPNSWGRIQIIVAKKPLSK